MFPSQPIPDKLPNVISTPSQTGLWISNSASIGSFIALAALPASFPQGDIIWALILYCPSKAGSLG